MPGNLRPAARSEFARGLYIGVQQTDELLWFSTDARQVYVGFLSLALLDANGAIVSIGDPVRPTWVRDPNSNNRVVTASDVVLTSPGPGANALVLASAPVANPEPEQLLAIAAKRIIPGNPLPGSTNVRFPAGKVKFGPQIWISVYGAGFNEFSQPLLSSGAAPNIRLNQLLYRPTGTQRVSYHARIDLFDDYLLLLSEWVGSAAFTQADGVVTNTIELTVVNDTSKPAPGGNRSEVYFGPSYAFFPAVGQAPWGTLYPGQAARFRPGKLKAVVT